VISIGTLAAHPLWEERVDVRTGHATTTLVTAGDANILVDPGLPGRILAARLGERSRIGPDDVTHVFITTFSQDHYRGLPAFPKATWLVHAPERAAAGAALDDQIERARDLDDAELASTIRDHLELLRRCRDAPDTLVPGVDLFPLPGLSAGTCGLLLPLPGSTVLICGDAIATVEHLEQAQVLPTCLDVEQAQESLREAIEIADVLVPGRDNVVVNPVRVM
jgi:glyoxylase-like metal-dependent hydrolase (beta-lactamase superfamily II)